MKIFKFMAIALVAMFGFTACDNECEHELNKACEHEFIEVDYSKKLAGIWTCIEPENEYAEALVINADGSVTSTGVFDGQLWEKKGSIKIKDNKMTLSFEDGDYLETRFEMVEGVAFALVDDYLDVRYDYYYCENDLADEIVGMWVSTDAPTTNGNVMTIQTYKENGKAAYTGFGSYVDDFLVNDETNYKVVGDLLFYELPQNMLPEGVYPYIIKRLTYAPNGNAYGDIMVQESQRLIDDKVVEATSSMLRVKQSLNLTGKTYDYISAYVTNVKGKDEDFSIVGNTFNIAKMNASNFDMMFRSVLSCLEFPNATTIKQHFLTNGVESGFDTPITVEGNKVTLDMSAGNPAYRKVEMYMFQDADDSQLHIYMPTASFINYFANLELVTLLVDGKIDLNDATAVAKVFADMEARIESVNVSLVYKARK